MNIWQHRKENFIADVKSTCRNFQHSKEWFLHPYVFQVMIQHYYVHSIDLFASKFNNNVVRFVSGQLIPGAWVTDAFSLNWSSFRFCCFPPLSIIGKSPERQGILIVRLWSMVYTTMVSNGNASNHCPSVIDQSQE